MNTALKFAVIGDPVKHSLSPQMHNAAFKAAGINASYTAYHVTSEQLPEFAEFARKELNGFNITVPHKARIIPFLDEISDEARIAGSVNTVTVLKDGKLRGDTTDGYGLQTAVYEAFGMPVTGENILFIGCGGAAQAAAVYFASQKAKKITVLNRTFEKALALCKLITDNYLEVSAEAAPFADPELCRKAAADCRIAAQCTSLGLKENDPSPIDVSILPDGICCYDTVYKDTAFQKAVKMRGLKLGSGLGMLLHQGARSFEIWLNTPAPVEVMRSALNRNQN